MSALGVVGHIGRWFLALVGAGFMAALCRSMLAPREALDPDGLYSHSAYNAPFSFVAEFGGEAVFVFLGVMLFVSFARIRSQIIVNLLLIASMLFHASACRRRMER